MIIHFLIIVLGVIMSVAFGYNIALKEIEEIERINEKLNEENKKLRKKIKKFKNQEN